MQRIISLIQILFNLLYMKTLKDFILESQNVNESLFGDIVRKLLDTGLSWIEKGVTWMLDTSKEVAKELWDTGKDTVSGVYAQFIKEHPEYAKKLPKSIKNANDSVAADTGIFYGTDVAVTHKIDYTKLLIQQIKSKKIQPDIMNKYIADKVANCYVGIIANPKSSDADKQKAKAFLNEVKASENDDVKKLIDERIKLYSSNMKK